MEENPSIQIGSITAYRCWYIRQHKDESSLTSFNGHIWPARQALQSKCGHNYCAPTIDCQCGIYAFDTFAEMLQQVPVSTNRRYHTNVYGQLNLWGTVHIHDRGFRAQYAYPTRLYAFTPKDEQLYTPLAAKYDLIIERMHAPILTYLPSYTISMSLKQKQTLTNAINMKRVQLERSSRTDG